MTPDGLSHDPAFRAAFAYLYGKQALEAGHGKEAFVPAPGVAQAQQAMAAPPGGAMAGGDPAAAAQMGGAPVDPAMAAQMGGAPVDPAMAAQMGGAAPPGGAPVDPAMMAQAGGAAPAGDPTAQMGGAPAPTSGADPTMSTQAAAQGLGLDQLKAVMREVLAETQGGQGGGQGGKGGKAGKPDLNQMHEMIQNQSTDLFQLRHAFNAVAEHLGIPVKVPDMNRHPETGLPTGPGAGAEAEAPGGDGAGGGGGGSGETPKAAGDFDFDPAALVHDFGRPVAAPEPVLAPGDPDGTAMAESLAAIYGLGGGGHATR